MVTPLASSRPAPRGDFRVGAPVGEILRPFDGFVASYDPRLRNSRWVVERITRDSVKGDGDRFNVPFVEDGSIEERFRARLSDYRGTGYDKGHMVSNDANEMRLTPPSPHKRSEMRGVQHAQPHPWPWLRGAGSGGKPQGVAAVCHGHVHADKHRTASWQRLQQVSLPLLASSSSCASRQRCQELCRHQGAFVMMSGTTGHGLRGSSRRSPRLRTRCTLSPGRSMCRSRAPTAKGTSWRIP